MQITFLGTGTSQGVPVIGCHCEVCMSKDPRDARLRTSLLIQEGETNVVIDAGPDFRQQMLRHPVPSLQAVLITHEHNDHIVGLDDIRPFYFRQREGISYYASARVFEEIKTRFPYVFQQDPYPGAPKIIMNTLHAFEEFRVGDLNITPIPVMHGNMEVFAFRLGKLTYITDASLIPPGSVEFIRGSEYLVINALRKERHYSHFSLEEALELISELNPRHAFITHISHLMGKTEVIEKELPLGCELAYDGLEVRWKS